MQAGMVSVDRKGNRPDLLRQGQGGAVMRVRVFVSFLARDAILKLLLGLAQVVEQASQLCLVFAFEPSGELFRPASHTQEMFNERLVRVGEDLSGVHGLVRCGRRFQVELGCANPLAKAATLPRCVDSNCQFAVSRSGDPSAFTAVCA